MKCNGSFLWEWVNYSSPSWSRLPPHTSSNTRLDRLFQVFKSQTNFISLLGSFPFLFFQRLELTQFRARCVGGSEWEWRKSSLESQGGGRRKIPPFWSWWIHRSNSRPNVKSSHAVILCNSPTVVFRKKELLFIIFILFQS